MEPKVANILTDTRLHNIGLILSSIDRRI